MADETAIGGMRRGEVLALVLTYNAPRNAAACVDALNRQARRPTNILVIENAGTDRVDAAALESSSEIPVTVVPLTENLGPAGGYAEGLRRAAASECDLIWLMDDDIEPDPTCLGELVTALDAHDRTAVVLPESVDAETGEPSSTWGWCGALVPRDLVDTIGLPIGELFYGFEDHEYLIARARHAGYPLVRASSALVRLGRRPGKSRPAWHYYYLARNATFVYLYRPHGVPVAQRLKRMVRFHYGLFRTIFVHQTDLRLRRIGLYVRGVFDGVFKRLGKRVLPTDDRRPLLAFEHDTGSASPHRAE